MLGQSRSTQHRRRKVRADEAALRSRRGAVSESIRPLRLPTRHGHAPHRGLGGEPQAGGADLEAGGAEGPAAAAEAGRLWLNDGSCIRLRPLYRGHVWSYDFVASRTHDGRALKLLTVLDEHTRECLAIVVARKIRAHDVLEVLADLFVRHGPPEYLRSDNGPEFTAKLVRRWLGRVGVETLFIEPGSPWENGYNESFNASSGTSGTGRSSTPGGGRADQQWRREYNTVRSACGGFPPDPEAIKPYAGGTTSAPWFLRMWYLGLIGCGGRSP